ERRRRTERDDTSMLRRRSECGDVERIQLEMKRRAGLAWPHAQRDGEIVFCGPVGLARRRSEPWLGQTVGRGLRYSRKQEQRDGELAHYCVRAARRRRTANASSDADSHETSRAPPRLAGRV